jgi:hypothetical protein
MADINAILDPLADALAYDGFNIQAVRKRAVAAIPQNDLIQILAAYAYVGNNVTRLQSVHDTAKGAELRALVSKYGITARTDSTDGLTLPRLASAFSPIVRYIRQRLAKTLDKRVDTEVPQEYCDPALSMHVDINKDFLIKFAKLIKQKGVSDEDQVNRTLQIAETAKRNAINDPAKPLQVSTAQAPNWLATFYRTPPPAPSTGKP